MLQLNLKNFNKLQGNMSDVKMAKKIGISRTQLWRIKNKKTNVGQKFIAGFMNRYPNEKVEDYFFVNYVAFQERDKRSKTA